MPSINHRSQTISIPILNHDGIEYPNATMSEGMSSPIRDAVKRQNHAAQSELEYLQRQLHQTQADNSEKGRKLSELTSTVLSLQDDLENATSRDTQQIKDLQHRDDLIKGLRGDMRAMERDIADIKADNTAAIKRHEEDNEVKEMLEKKNKARKKELEALQRAIDDLKLENRAREEEYAETTASAAEDQRRLGAAEVFVRGLLGLDEKDTPLEECLTKVSDSIQMSCVAEPGHQQEPQQEQEKTQSIKQRRRVSSVYKGPLQITLEQELGGEESDTDPGYLSSSSIPCNTHKAVADELDGMSSWDEDEDGTIIIDEMTAGSTNMTDPENENHNLEGLDLSSHDNPEPYTRAASLGQPGLITIAAVEPDMESSDENQPPSQGVRTSVGVQTERVVLQDQVSEKPNRSEQGIQTDDSADIARTRPSERILQLEPATRSHTTTAMPMYLDSAWILLGNMIGGGRFKPHFDDFLPDTIAQHIRPAPRDQKKVPPSKPADRLTDHQHHRHPSELTVSESAAVIVEHVWQCMPGWVLLVVGFAVLLQLYTWTTDDKYQWQRANEALLPERCPLSGSDNRWLLVTDRGL